MEKQKLKNKKIISILVVIAIVLIIVILQFSKVSFIKLENSSKINSNSVSERVLEKSKLYPAAKELVHPDGFININPFNLSDYIGKKVILLDFWTYSCINCQRTFPYLESWNEKYSDKGLLIIGIHTPEFNFEKEYNNVQKATEEFGIKYPVVLDNNYLTWQAYGNQYWPREYLIDIDGFIVHDHIGEGGYAETETAIQDALKERLEVLGMNETINSGLTQGNSTIQFSGIKT
ncbi:thiol-disulfide isomerase, partial [Candidatus Pacearchaeota archaeon CG_4_9_14_0_2_um_filter_30_8]